MIVLNEINKDEALRYMGHRGEIPQTLKELVLKCEKQLLEVIRPAYIFKCFDIETSLPLRTRIACVGHRFMQINLP